MLFLVVCFCDSTGFITFNNANMQVTDFIFWWLYDVLECNLYVLYKYNSFINIILKTMRAIKFWGKIDCNFQVFDNIIVHTSVYRCRFPGTICVLFRPDDKSQDKGALKKLLGCFITLNVLHLNHHNKFFRFLSP